MKSVGIRSIFWSVSSCIQSKYRKIRTRKYSVSGHFSRSECESKSRFRNKSVSIFWLFFREFYTTTFLCKSVDWFLYDRDLRHKRINKAMSLIIVTAIFIERLSSTNFTWYILEYFVPYDTLLNKPIEICSSSRWFIFHLTV